MASPADAGRNRLAISSHPAQKQIVKTHYTQRDGGSPSMPSFFTMHGSRPTRARPQEQPAPVQSGRHKRKNSIEDALQPASDHKRQQVSPPRTAEGAFCEPADARGAHEHVEPLAFWVKEQRWPHEQDWPEATSETDATMDPPFARRSPRRIRPGNDGARARPLRPAIRGRGRRRARHTDNSVMRRFSKSRAAT